MSNPGKPGAKRCPWIRLDVDLDHHPKVGKLAEVMKCDDERALARLIRFWMGVRVHAPRGVLTDISDATIGQWMRAPSNRAAAWVDALRAVGLIVGAEVVGWKERQLGVVEKAEADAKKRKTPAEPESYPSVTPALPARVTLGTRALPEPNPSASGSGSGSTSADAEVAAATPRGLFGEPVEKSKADLRAELVAAWNEIAAETGLPRLLKADPWAKQIDARIGEGLLTAWPTVAAGIRAVVARHGARPTWLKFSHLVHNGQNWQKLEADGQQAEAVHGESDPLDAARRALSAALPLGPSLGRYKHHAGTFTRYPDGSVRLALPGGVAALDVDLANEIGTKPGNHEAEASRLLRERLHLDTATEGAA